MSQSDVVEFVGAVLSTCIDFSTLLTRHARILRRADRAPGLLRRQLKEIKDRDRLLATANILRGASSGIYYPEGQHKAAFLCGNAAGVLYDAIGERAKAIDSWRATISDAVRLNRGDRVVRVARRLRQALSCEPFDPSVWGIYFERLSIIYTVFGNVAGGQLCAEHARRAFNLQTSALSGSDLSQTAELHTLLTTRNVIEAQRIDSPRQDRAARLLDCAKMLGAIGAPREAGNTFACAFEECLRLFGDDNTHGLDLAEEVLQEHGSAKESMSKYAELTFAHCLGNYYCQKGQTDKGRDILVRSVRERLRLRLYLTYSADHDTTHPFNSLEFLPDEVRSKSAKFPKRGDHRKKLAGLDDLTDFPDFLQHQVRVPGTGHTEGQVWVDGTRPTGKPLKDDDIGEQSYSNARSLAGRRGWDWVVDELKEQIRTQGSDWRDLPTGHLRSMIGFWMLCQGGVVDAKGITCLLKIDPEDARNTLHHWRSQLRHFIGSADAAERIVPRGRNRIPQTTWSYLWIRAVRPSSVLFEELSYNPFEDQNEWPEDLKHLVTATLSSR